MSGEVETSWHLASSIFGSYKNYFQIFFVIQIQLEFQESNEADQKLKDLQFKQCTTSGGSFKYSQF